MRSPRRPADVAAAPRAHAILRHAASGCAGLYLERTDQAQGGYGLTARIELTGETLCVWLSSEGAEVLEFDAQCLCFTLDCPPDELAAARKVLMEMQADGAPVVIVAA